MTSNSPKYEKTLLVILFLAFGLVFMDRMSFNFLLPFITKDLGMNNSQSGLVLGVLSAFFGLSTLVFSSLSDLLGAKKKMLIVFVCLFSVATLAAGFISSFASLVVIRAIMGTTEGPVIPLILSTVLAESRQERRGFNMGLIKSAGPLMSAVLAPLILIPIATHYGWRTSFYLLAVPGLVLALVLAKVMREPVFAHVAGEAAARPTFVEYRGIFKLRNIWLGMAISVFFTMYLTSFIGFIPLFLDKILRYTQGQSTVYLSLFGIGGFLWMFLVPLISDRFGRKPTLVAFALLAVLLPVGAASFNANYPLMLLMVLVLTCGIGYMPLYDSIIPAESVPPKFAASAMASIVLVGEVIGGSLGPIISGSLADKYDLHAPLWVAAFAAGMAFLLTLGIRETAPAKRRDTSPQVLASY